MPCRPPAIITEEIFCAYLKCKYKGYLKLQATVGEVSEYERLMTRVDVEYQKTAGRQLLRIQGSAAIAENPLPLPEMIQSGKELIRERLAQRDDWPRIAEVLVDTPNDFPLAHSHKILSHLRWRATSNRVYRPRRR
jgi:hypothetical protein